VKDTSQISGFYRLTTEERAATVSRLVALSRTEQDALESGGLELDRANRMIENVIGVYDLPLGVATNFLVNGVDYLIPMVIEEPSVVAGASYAAKLARAGGGFVTQSTPSEMIAQIQVLDLVDPWSARFALLNETGRLLEFADAVDPVVVGVGGGARDLEVHVISDSRVGPMLEVRLVYDCRDAMGANVLNTIAESLAPEIERISGGRVNLRIVSNLAERRLARARCVIPSEALTVDAFPGEAVVERILEAHAFALATPYRAATHNKGIMNGVDAVVVATGNDWRAIEAGAHAYAARQGRYSSLSQWEKNQHGHLVGTLEMPVAVGTVGGATRVHPTAKLALKILGVQSARELAEVIAAVGLAQNLAALRALATEGIQRGHMQLHARQVAIAAGAEGDEVDLLVQRMVKEKLVRADRANALLAELRESVAR